jgi:hypothetical protein
MTGRIRYLVETSERDVRGRIIPADWFDDDRLQRDGMPGSIPV